MAQEWWLNDQPVATGTAGGTGTFVPAPGAAEATARAEAEAARQAEAADRAARAEQRDIQTAQRGNIGELRREFIGNASVVRPFKEVEAATRQVVGLANRTDNADVPGPGDIALIFSYMKTLDPGSVVREGEFATAQNAGGIPESIRNYYNRVVGGGRLSPALRTEFANTALNIYESRAQSYNDVANMYRGLIIRAGGDPDAEGVTLAPRLRPQQVTVGEGEAAPQVGAKVPGQPFLTQEDISIRNQIQAAWDSGASPEDIVALASQLGRPGSFGAAELARMREARLSNQPVQFNALPSGQPSAAESLLGQLVSTPAGEQAAGYFGSALNALTGGFYVPTEIKDYLRREAAPASFAGELTGGALAAVPAIRGAQGILAGTRLAAAAPLIGETAYGALYGAGEAGEGNRMTGALLGGAGALAGGALINRFLPGGPGTFTGAPRPQAPAPTRFAGAQPTAQELIAAGQQANIPVMTSDIMPPTTRMGQLGQALSEVAPLGTAGMRREQQVARQDAVENLLADYGVTVDATIADDVVRNLTDNRAAMLDRLTQQKDNVISRLSAAGDVPTPRSVAAIDSLLTNLRRQNLPQLEPLINQLDGVRNSLTGPGDLSKIEANRRTIFTLKGDPSLANISTTSERAFTDVYNALNEDMGDFIRSAGGTADFRLWRTANMRLAQMAGELQVGGLRGVLNRGEFDPTTVTRMLTSSRPEEARTLFRNLNNEGRQNARLLLIQEAARRALNADTQVVDPNRFAREVGRLSDNFGQFFSASDRRRVEGLAEVLRATRRAQDAQFLPRTGEQLVPIGAASSLGGLSYLLGFGVLEGAAAAAMFGASRRFMESPTGRDLLLRISQASGTRKAELINQFVAGASATAGAAVGSRMANQPEQ